MRTSKPGSAGPTVPKRKRLGRLTDAAVVHSVRPQPSTIRMSSAWKNSPISFASGAPPEMPSAQPAAEPLLHLAVDEPVGEAVLEAQAGGYRESGLPQLAHAAADAQRPVEQPAPRARAPASNWPRTAVCTFS